MGRPIWLPNGEKITKKTSKEAVRDCTTCGKKVAKIGQHLDKVHRNLLPEHRKFLKSFYSTKNARGPVSQCVNCPLRMTNPRRHNNYFPRHIILKVRNKKSDKEFPPQIRELSEKKDLRPKSAELLEEYSKKGVTCHQPLIIRDAVCSIEK